MNRASIRQILFPLLTALIWGTAFVFQSVGADFIPSFTYNASRSVVATVALALILAVFPKLREPPPEDISKKQNFKNLALGGALCGAALTIASYLQQLGIAGTTVGKAGFITALYIVIVPALGVFLGKKVSLKICGGVVLAVVGLYLLCIEPGSALGMSPGDFYIMLSALCFSAHILLIDRFTRTCGGIELSLAQFFVVSVLSFFGALIFETPTLDGITKALPSIFFVGFFSSAIGYTLQILGQKGANPTVVSLILSLESVFAAVSGAVFLREGMAPREFLGCVIMFAAVVWAQLPQRVKKQIEQ